MLHVCIYNIHNMIPLLCSKVKFHIKYLFGTRLQKTNMLPRKPKISYRYLKSGIEEFHRKYVLVPADKAANSVVV